MSSENVDRPVEVPLGFGESSAESSSQSGEQLALSKRSKRPVAKRQRIEVDADVSPDESKQYAETRSTLTQSELECDRELYHIRTRVEIRDNPQFRNAYSAIEKSLSSEKSSLEFVQQNCVTRRYIFTIEKIVSLKNIVVSDDHVWNPTRVEAVSGLLWKCAMKAGSRPSLWSLAMKIRKRVEPSFGDNVVDLHVLVDKLRKGIEEAVKNFAKKGRILRSVQGQLGEFTKLMKIDEIDFYTCASWCRFGLYDADFGWEKPIWVSLVSGDFKNAFVLVDTRDGDGIEAWLMFSEEDMASIESNQELLAFASLNPSVI